jgi:hypothetical protein
MSGHIVCGAEVSEKTVRNSQFQSFGQYLRNACNEQPNQIFMVSKYIRVEIYCVPNFLASMNEK